MSDKFKDSKFYRTMKNPKVTRALYIALVVLLVGVVAIIGVTAAMNRAKKKPSEDPKVEDTSKPHVTKDPIVTKAPETSDTSAPTTDAGAVTEDPTTPVVSTLPSFSLPVSGNVTKYHDAKVQVFSDTMNDYRVHLGVDIATKESAPVYAAATGKIQKIWKDTLMGYCVAISHSGDAVTIYKNLSDTLPDGIVEGASVKAGQQIASVGDSAMIEIADEPHLHFEMTVGGIQADPLEYFSESDLKALSVDESYGE